jgi:twitching motility protein PilT
MSFVLEDALRAVVEMGGSDLHLKVPAPPLVRQHGGLVPVPGADILQPEDTEGCLREMLGQGDRLADFHRDGEVDFSHTVPGLARYRVNAFRQRGSISIAFRVVPFAIRSIAELDLPTVIAKLAEEERGIILVTGTTGSGKSTTLAAMVDHINSNFPKNIVTIEDPIEYLHKDKCSIVHQREVGFDTMNFPQALRRVLRQDPDVILIGEMRDEETVGTALSAAETGHLVLSTLHTIDAIETINRIIDFFPPHHHQQVRAMLGGSLRGVISQRLVPTVDGKGRAAACEILTTTGRVRDMIIDSKETGKLGEAIADGTYYGMQTFDQALLHLHRAGQVSMEDALKAATHPHDFKLLVASDGHGASSVDQVFSENHKTVSESPPGRPAEPKPAATPQSAANGTGNGRPPRPLGGGGPPTRTQP